MSITQALLRKSYRPLELCFSVETGLNKICEKTKNTLEYKYLKHKIRNMMILYIGLLDLRANDFSIRDYNEIFPYTFFIYNHIKDNLEKVLNKEKAILSIRKSEEHIELTNDIIELVIRLSVLIKQHI